MVLFDASLLLDSPPMPSQGEAWETSHQRDTRPKLERGTGCSPSVCRTRAVTPTDKESHVSVYDPGCDRPFTPTPFRCHQVQPRPSPSRCCSSQAHTPLADVWPARPRRSSGMMAATCLIGLGWRRSGEPPSPLPLPPISRCASSADRHGAPYGVRSCKCSSTTDGWSRDRGADGEAFSGKGSLTLQEGLPQMR